MKRGRSLIALLAVVIFGLAACGGESTGSPTAQQPEATAPPDLATAVFQPSAGGTAVMYVEVADTEELRTCGLMHRLSMPQDQGMLFVFTEDYRGGFWNRNTFIPLSLAWIAADGTILDFSEMDPVRPEDNPQVNTTYTPALSSRLPRYVIEANRGWFTSHGVAVGDRADLSAPLARGSQGATPICREKGL